MSVPEPLRRKSEFHVQVEANRLAKYTLEITSNPRVFDVKYTPLTERIIDMTLSIAKDIWDANSLDLFDEMEHRTRRRLQNQAIRECNDLQFYIILSKRTFHLRDRRVGYWSTLAWDLENSVRRWRDSDASRRRSYLQGKDAA